MGCTPRLAVVTANSSAPNRLPVSVMATAGMSFARQRSISSGILMAPSERE
jgi:hypothetical protein